IPLIVEHEGRVFPQLGLKVACDILGLDVMKYKIIKTPLSRYIKIGDKKENALYIPVDERNQILVNWAAPWGKAFKHYSYIDTITSYERVLSKNTPHIILEGFKDKICIIGLTAPGLHDIKPNVLQPAYPAVGTNANIINSILNRDFIRKAPRWLDGFLILFMGIFLSMNITKVKPIRGASIAVLMLAAYTLMSFTILDSMGLWVVLIHPLAAILLSYLVITFYNQIVIAIEQSKLYTLATKDGLTGLFVVRHFNLLLEAEINMIESRGGELAILMIDVDHFKEINDRYGHQAGDFILKGVADIVISYCRQLDVPSRYGGEEFIMMLPGAALSDAATVAERMRRRIEGNSFRQGNIEYRVTISVGVASFKEKDTKDDLIKKADKALYEAKEGGRNKVCLERS
ncbi:MAG: diguanylate cyclase, partial [Candidatus Omnitrophica bacterium]|nr:diguanylate cyclase [Candidatus Omnitrophota bacterium]